MPLFEVWLDGKRKFWTDDENCIPPDSVQADMYEAGYKLMYQGKRITPKRRKHNG